MSSAKCKDVWYTPPVSKKKDKTRGGREETRSLLFNLRVSPCERDTINQKAQRERMTAADWVRRMLGLPPVKT